MKVSKIFINGSSKLGVDETLPIIEAEFSRTQWQYSVTDMWRRPLAPKGQKPKLLIADMHKAQKTPAFVDKLKRECKTDVVLVPPGYTSLIQPLDVSLDSKFKSVIDKLQTEHMHDHLDEYINNSLSASARHILITKQVRAAWEQVSQKKDMVRCAFKKCGISVAVDGSEDAAINICGLKGYTVCNIDSDSEPEEDPFELDPSDNECSDDETIDVRTSVVFLIARHLLYYAMIHSYFNCILQFTLSIHEVLLFAWVLLFRKLVVNAQIGTNIHAVFVIDGYFGVYSIP